MSATAYGLTYSPVLRHGRKGSSTAPIARHRQIDTDGAAKPMPAAADFDTAVGQVLNGLMDYTCGATTLASVRGSALVAAAVADSGVERSSASFLLAAFDAAYGTTR